jgi:hypothetical protein
VRHRLSCLWLVHPLNRRCGAISASAAVRRVITTVLFSTLTLRCDTSHSKGELPLLIRADIGSPTWCQKGKLTGKRLWRTDDRQDATTCDHKAVVCYTLSPRQAEVIRSYEEEHQIRYGVDKQASPLSRSRKWLSWILVQRARRASRSGLQTSMLW